MPLLICYNRQSVSVTKQCLFSQFLHIFRSFHIILQLIALHFIPTDQKMLEYGVLCKNLNMVALRGLRLFNGNFNFRHLLTLLHSERSKLYTILAFLSAIGLNTSG